MDIDAQSPGGNAMAIMGAVTRLLKEVGRRDECAAVQKRMMSGNYDNVCAVAEEVTNGSIRVVNRVNGEDEANK